MKRRKIPATINIDFSMPTSLLELKIKLENLTEIYGCDALATYGVFMGDLQIDYYRLETNKELEKRARQIENLENQIKNLRED